MIRYVVGDATQPPIAGGETRVICHVCNDVGAWGAGFVLAVSRRWPNPEREYRAAFERTPRPQLGEVQLCRVESGLYVANMIAQHGFPSASRPVALDYTALVNCMVWLGQYAERGWSFHMPRIGCGIAGGDWRRVSSLIETALADFQVIVYDLPAPTGPRHARLT